MLISRSTCAPRLESSCSSNTLMKEDSGYRKYSYGKQRFLPAWFDKISRIFSFFLLPFFFFIFSSTFENSRTGPLYGNVPRAQAKGKALLSCCSKQFLARKNLAAPHFPLPAIPSLSSPLLRFSLSLSLFRIFPILDALHHPSLPPLNGTSSRFLHQREGKNCKNTS